MATQTIWLSYDLGVQGDYEGLYEWLDGHGARECGDSLAILKYTYRRDLLKQLRAELEKSVQLTKRSRIYVIYRSDRDQRVKGIFLIGRRRASPWQGTSGSGEQYEDE